MSCPRGRAPHLTTIDETSRPACVTEREADLPVGECLENGLELIETVVDALTTTPLHQRLAHLSRDNNTSRDTGRHRSLYQLTPAKIRL